MDKLTLKIEYTDFLNNDLENYLKDLNGVKIIKINNSFGKTIQKIGIMRNN